MTLEPQAPLLANVRGQFAEFPYGGGRADLLENYKTRPSLLARVSPQTPWAVHPGAPVSVLGTGAGDPSQPPFHGPRGSAEPAYAGHSPLRPLLAITALQGLRVVSQVAPAWGPLVRLPRGVGGWALRYREAYPRGTGILTCFPFPGSELRSRLGPANSRLTTIAGKP